MRRRTAHLFLPHIWLTAYHARTFSLCPSPATFLLTFPPWTVPQVNALAKQQTTELSFLQTSAFVDQVYLYAGLAVDNKHETGFIAKEIRKHNYQTVIRLFTSLDDATFRAVLWDQAVHCLVWPPFVRYPGISETAKTDLRAYTAAGNNVVFLGNYVAVQFMNDVYGFQLMDDYQNGPYYRYTVCSSPRCVCCFSCRECQ